MAGKPNGHSHGNGVAYMWKPVRNFAPCGGIDCTRIEMSSTSSGSEFDSESRRTDTFLTGVEEGVRKLKDDRAALQAANQQLQDQIDSLKQTRNELSDTSTTCESQLVVLQGEKDRLQTEINERKTNNAELNLEKIELEGKLDKAQQEWAQKETELEYRIYELEQTAESSERGKATLAEELKSRRQQDTDTIQRSRDLARELTSTTKRLELQTKEVERLTAEKKNMAESTRKTEAELAMAGKLIAKTNEDLDAMRERLAQNTKKMEEVTRLKNEAVQSLERVEQELKQLNMRSLEYAETTNRKLDAILGLINDQQ